MTLLHQNTMIRCHFLMSQAWRFYWSFLEYLMWNKGKFSSIIYYLILYISTHTPRLPWLLCGKEPAYQYRRCGFDPWARKIPWKRKWQQTPVFLPGKSHGLQSMGSRKSQSRLATEHAHTPYTTAKRDGLIFQIIISVSPKVFRNHYSSYCH